MPDPLPPSPIVTSVLESPLLVGTASGDVPYQPISVSGPVASPALVVGTATVDDSVGTDDGTFDGGTLQGGMFDGVGIFD